jgi:two-component system NarL family sensor kinase
LEETVIRASSRVVGVASAAAVVALVVAGQVSGAAAPMDATTMLLLPIAVAYSTLGAVVLAGVPGHRVGRLMLAVGGAAAVAVLALSWSDWLIAAWLSQWLWWPPFGLIFLGLTVFPDGRLPSRRWRAVAAVIVGGTAVTTLCLAYAAIDHPRDLVTGVVDMTPRTRLLVRIGAAALVLTVLAAVAALCSLGFRWRRAGGEVRRQLACLLAAGVVSIVGVVLDVIALSGAEIVVAFAVPLGMAVAMLRHRLYGMDQFVNRTIVWLVMTLLVIAAFVVSVSATRAVLGSGDASTASLVVTGLIAVGFEPLRRLVQRAVDRLLYGRRDDPYRVIAALGDLLGRTVEPGSVLPLLTGTVSRELQVPYVAVEVPVADGARLVAEHGDAGTAVEAFDMISNGEPVGRLLVANRGTGSRFTRRERRLLGDVALQAAVAVKATCLLRDLQRSRERLVVAREEERRRFRRDLHDGVGPALAGMGMQVRAAQRQLDDHARVERILTALTGDLASCSAEVRRLVDQLRPPALDAGLEAALRQECGRFDGAGLMVRLTVGGSLADLPAAFEVATYRVVGEALANVVRHSGASTCQVSVRRGLGLSIEIVDDGAGFDDGVRRGVGLDSMRERVVELGGDCTVERVAPHGTAVRAHLPIPSSTESTVDEPVGTPSPELADPAEPVGPIGGTPAVSVRAAAGTVGPDGGTVVSRTRVPALPAPADRADVVRTDGVSIVPAVSVRAADRPGPVADAHPGRPTVDAAADAALADRRAGERVDPAGSVESDGGAVVARTPVAATASAMSTVDGADAGVGETLGEPR